MSRAHRVSTTVALMVCLVGSPASGTLFASEQEPSPAVEHRASMFDATALAPTAAAIAHPAGKTFQPVFTFRSAESNAFEQRGWYRGRGRHEGAVAAVAIGAVATITGAAILVYANRPECSANQFAGGCGYGTKVVGGAVLAGGMVGLMVGALAW